MDNDFGTSFGPRVSVLQAPSLLRGQKALTLIEVMISIALLGILLGIAVPSYQQMIVRNRLKGATESLYADLQFARSEAIKRNQEMFVSFATAAPWCYGIDDTAACNCKTANDCQVAGQTRVITGADYGGTNMSGAAFAGGGSSTVFNPQLGTAQTATLAPRNGTITLLSPDGDSTQVRVSLAGRINICSDDLWSYEGC